MATYQAGIKFFNNLAPHLKSLRNKGTIQCSQKKKKNLNIPSLGCVDEFLFSKNDA
jgi:hypothetical protein